MIPVVPLFISLKLAVWEKFYLSEISMAQAEVLELTTSLARALKTVSGPGSKT